MRISFVTVTNYLIKNMRDFLIIEKIDFFKSLKRISDLFNFVIYFLRVQ